jgi:hypothetical protein
MVYFLHNISTPSCCWSLFFIRWCCPNTPRSDKPFICPTVIHSILNTMVTHFQLKVSGTWSNHRRLECVKISNLSPAWYIFYTVLNGCFWRWSPFAFDAAVFILNNQEKLQRVQPLFKVSWKWWWPHFLLNVTDAWPNHGSNCVMNLRYTVVGDGIYSTWVLDEIFSLLDLFLH